MPQLLERERELDRLGERLDAARAGEGGLVVVEGAPGLGKTSLLRATVREAQPRGFEIARARGAELEREWPFGVVRQLLEPSLRARPAEERAQLLEGAAGLAAHVVMPEPASGAAAVDAGFGALHGLYWLCANLATQRPLLLAVDDAHWADEPSLRFLGVLARRLDALPALLVLAQRPAPPGPLAELAADPQTERLELRPLSPAAVGELLAEWSPDGVDPDFALACQAATGGNPFLLSRLGPGLHERAVSFTGAQSDRVADAGTEAVRAAVAATLARLPPASVALAEACAVLGDGTGLSTAAALAGIAEGAAAAEELARAGVLEDARPLRFVHAIVRDAVAAGLPASVRGALHGRAAELLAARHAAPDAVAVHLLATEPRGRPWVVERLAGAARRALAHGAPESALRGLERALAEPPSTDALRAELMLDLARAESGLGRHAALEHFRAAQALSRDPVLRARATLELGWAAGPHLDVPEQVALIERSIAELDGDRELTLELEAARLSALQLSAPVQARHWQAGDFQRWSGLAGHTPGERLLLAQLALAQMHAGGPAGVAGDYAERAAGEQVLGSIGGAEMALMFVLIMLYKTDRLDAAERVLDRELRAARRRGSLSTYALVCTFRGAVASRRGALAAAEADFRAGLDALTPDSWQRAQLSAGLLDILVDTGELPAAQALLGAGGWNAELPDNRSATVLLASRSRLRVAQGDPHRALADALEARRRMGHTGGSVDTNWHGRARIALLQHATGDPEEARRETAALIADARRWDTPAAVGQALHVSGLIERGDRGLALLRDAVEQLERSPARLELAHALVDHGAALRRHGDRAAARDPLRRGLDIAAATGARPLAERARHELAATGVRVRHEAQTGIAALTPSERRIAEHAAGGATNPQIAQALFVTVKTVEMHLGNAYRKLDIASRHELARQLQAAPPE